MASATTAPLFLSSSTQVRFAASGAAHACGGDKAFAGHPFRMHLRSRGIRAVIPTKSNQPRRRGFDREAYRARNRVERLFNRLKQFRRIATRYEKRAQNYLAMLHIAAITLWL